MGKKSKHKKIEEKPILKTLDFLGDQAIKTVKTTDLAIFVIVLLLAIFGVAMVFSAGSYITLSSEDSSAFYYLKRDLALFLIGLVFMLIAANFDYHYYAHFMKIFLVISIVLLLATYVPGIGITVNGSRRWLGYGSLRFTPSEFSKLFVILFTSCYLASEPYKIKSFRSIMELSIVALVHFILIFKQPNLSTALLILMIMFAIMFAAGLNYTYVFLAIGAVALGAFCLFKFAPDSYWVTRFMSFLDPFADSQGEGYQVTQGLIALGNGGLFGLGPGNSISKNLYLPEPTNDFILAIIGEELGFVGFLVLMLVYVLLINKFMLVTLHSKDKLGFYIGTGISAMLGIQVIMNVAVVTSSIPATGVTLPFISYGGSSLWMFMISAGIMLNISKHK